MKRIKFLLSKWLLKLSKKIDSKSENMFVKSHPKIDKISAKYEISDDTINLFGSSIGQDFLKSEIDKRLAAEIGNEIMKMYANKIKIVQNIERGSVIYACDIYLYNPQKKLISSQLPPPKGMGLLA